MQKKAKKSPWDYVKQSLFIFEEKPVISIGLGTLFAVLFVIQTALMFMRDEGVTADKIILIILDIIIAALFLFIGLKNGKRR